MISQSLKEANANQEKDAFLNIYETKKSGNSENINVEDNQSIDYDKE